MSRLQCQPGGLKLASRDGKQTKKRRWVDREKIVSYGRGII